MYENDQKFEQEKVSDSSLSKKSFLYLGILFIVLFISVNFVKQPQTDKQFAQAIPSPASLFNPTQAPMPVGNNGTAAPSAGSSGGGFDPSQLMGMMGGLTGGGTGGFDPSQLMSMMGGLTGGGTGSTQPSTSTGGSSGSGFDFGQVVSFIAPLIGPLASAGGGNWGPLSAVNVGGGMNIGNVVGMMYDLFK